VSVDEFMSRTLCCLLTPRFAQAASFTAHGAARGELGSIFARMVGFRRHPSTDGVTHYMPSRRRVLHRPRRLAPLPPSKCAECVASLGYLPRPGARGVSEWGREYSPEYVTPEPRTFHLARLFVQLGVVGRKTASMLGFRAEARSSSAPGSEPLASHPGARSVCSRHSFRGLEHTAPRSGRHEYSPGYIMPKPRTCHFTLGERAPAPDRAHQRRAETRHARGVN
jgi:hypothetical protein